MKVIRHGSTYKEIKCTKCCALLSYCEIDIKHDNREDDNFGEWHYSYRKYVVCPECKNEINLSWNIDGEEIVK